MPTPLTTVAETTITDVSFVVSYLSLFLSCENYTHFIQAQHVLVLLKINVGNQC